MGQPTSTGEVRQYALDTEKKYGLPEGMLYKQLGIESSFGKAMLSPKGAQGWMGFMPATAKEYGLDDPNDFHKSVDAGGRKMRDLLKAHGGNEDYALVDYNGGHKAVKALKAGKPWGESAGYLAKYHGVTKDEIGQRTYAQQQMGDQFTSQTTVSPTDGPSATGLAYATRQHENEFGGIVNGVRNLPAAIGLGFETQNTVYNFVKDQGVNSTTGDLLDWNSQDAQDTLKRFPESHWGYLLQGTTKDGLEKRAVRLRETMQKEQELGHMGLGPALIGGIAGGLVDLPTLLAFVPGAGGAGLLTKASRLQNAVRMGLIGGGTNVVYDAVANQYKPTATADDLYISAAFGFGLGALSGGAASLKRIGALDDEARRLREWGMREGKKGMREEIEGAKPKAPDGTHAPAPGWNKGVDDWLNDRPRETPPVGIVRGGHEDLPGALKAPEVGLSPKAPGDAPVEGTKAKPWSAEWDKPIYRERNGGHNILELPPVRKISQLADYVRTHSKNTDIVALMDRALKGIDLRKLRFDIVDPKTNFANLAIDARIAQKMHGALGLVSTPHGSSGDGLQMALRGHGWGADMHGLNEETFVHELLHAATVYKMLRVQKGQTKGMKAESVKAIKELEALHQTVVGKGVPPEFGIQLGDSFEFISYGLTQRKFQDWLKTVQVDGPKTTLWTKFTDGLRKMLGMSPSEGSAYAKLIDLSDHLTRKAGIEGSPKLTTNLEAAGEHISKADIEAANTADIPTVFGWGLGLEHKLMGKKLPTEVRELAGKLFGTTVGHKGHAVVQRNAWDDTVMRAESWTANMRKTAYGAFDKWFTESGKKFHEKGEAFEDFGAQVGNYVRGFDGDFHPEVKRAGDHLRKLYSDVADEINVSAR